MWKKWSSICTEKPFHLKILVKRLGIEEMTQAERTLKSLRYCCVVCRKGNVRKGDRQKLKLKVFQNYWEYPRILTHRHRSRKRQSFLQLEFEINDRGWIQNKQSKRRKLISEVTYDSIIQWQDFRALNRKPTLQLTFQYPPCYHFLSSHWDFVILLNNLGFHSRNTRLYSTEYQTSLLQPSRATALSLQCQSGTKLSP